MQELLNLNNTEKTTAATVTPTKVTVSMSNNRQDSNEQQQHQASDSPEIILDDSNSDKIKETLSKTRGTNLEKIIEKLNSMENNDIKLSNGTSALEASLKKRFSSQKICSIGATMNKIPKTTETTPNNQNILSLPNDIIFENNNHEDEDRDCDDIIGEECNRNSANNTILFTDNEVEEDEGGILLVNGGDNIGHGTDGDGHDEDTGDAGACDDDNDNMQLDEGFNLDNKNDFNQQLLSMIQFFTSHMSQNNGPNSSSLLNNPLFSLSSVLNNNNPSVLQCNAAQTTEGGGIDIAASNTVIGSSVVSANPTLAALASSFQASNIFSQAQHNNSLANLVNNSTNISPANDNSQSEAGTNNQDNNSDSNKTIYRGLYPIKDVKDYFTRTINEDGEKVYWCKFSGCSFQTKQYSQHISRHIYLKHIGIKKELRCRQCDKRFQRPESLVQHEKNHVCGFGIDQDRMNDPTNPCGKVNIKKHFKKVTDHEFDVYQCQFGECKFHTNNSGSIRRHVHNQHICTYASVNNNHSASTSSSSAAVVASNHGHSNQYNSISNASSSNTLVNATSNIDSSGNRNSSNSLQNALRSVSAELGPPWPEVQCQLIVGEQDYRPEISDDLSRISSRAGVRSDDEDDAPMNLAQPDCPIRNPIDQQQFDDNSAGDSHSDGQHDGQQHSGFSGSSSFPNTIGSPSQGTSSAPGNKKNNGLYSLKNYKQYYTKRKTEDGSGYVFVCSICNKFKATQQISLIRHIWTETQHSHFACEFEDCNEKFNSEFARYRHRKTVHQQQGQSAPLPASVNGNGDVSALPDVSIQDLTARISGLSNLPTEHDSLSIDFKKLFQAQTLQSETEAQQTQKKLQKQEHKQQEFLSLFKQFIQDQPGNDAISSNFLPNFTDNEVLQLPTSRQQNQTSNQLIKLLNAPSGTLAKHFDLDFLPEGSSEPPKKRSRMLPKSDTSGMDNLLTTENNAVNLPSTSSTLANLDFLKSTLENVLPSTSSQVSDSNNANNAQAKPKNPTKSGLYSLKAHQDHFVRKKKEGGNGYEYFCKDCQEYTTSSQASMVRHLWSHQSQDFTCNVCNAKFENEFNLYKHKKQFHPEATTQHNRGAKGGSKKQQAQALKKQQQQQQQHQQQLQQQNQHNQHQTRQQSLLQSPLQRSNISTLFNQLTNSTQQHQTSNSLLSDDTVSHSLGGYSSFPDVNLASMMAASPDIVLQFMSLLQRTHQQQQQQQQHAQNNDISLASLLLSNNDVSMNNEISMREMSNNDDDSNFAEYEVEACSDNVKNTSGNDNNAVTPLLPHQWYQAAMASVGTSSGNNRSTHATTLPGLSRRALQFKQKKYHRKIGKIRTIDNQNQGDHCFGDTADEDEDNDTQINGESDAEIMPSNEIDTEEDEDLNNNVEQVAFMNHSNNNSNRHNNTFSLNRNRSSNSNQQKPSSNNWSIKHSNDFNHNPSNGHFNSFKPSYGQFNKRHDGLQRSHKKIIKDRQQISSNDHKQLSDKDNHEQYESDISEHDWEIDEEQE